jgi:hypothetical protein
MDEVRRSDPGWVSGVWLHTFRRFAPASASMLRLDRGRATPVAGEGWRYTSAGPRALTLNQPVPEWSR